MRPSIKDGHKEGGGRVGPKADISLELSKGRCVTRRRDNFAGLLYGWSPLLVYNGFRVMS